MTRIATRLRLRATALPGLVIALTFATSARPQGAAAPGAVGKAALSEKPTAVLGGRLTIRMPGGSRSEARPFAIMAAPTPDEDETRLIFDAGPERFVILAHEAYATAGDDLARTVRSVVDGWEKSLGTAYRVEPFPLDAKGLRAVAVRPANPPDRSRGDDAIFLEGLLVASADGTVQSLDAYINPAGAKDLGGASALARRALRTVAPGGRRLAVEAGERRFKSGSSDLLP
jgi:hypothetical protein